MTRRRYWLTPPELYARLDAEHQFDFDPCPYPRPDGFNSLLMPWGQRNFVNPPFRRADGADGRGPTAFVRKAIAERDEHGRESVLLLPVPHYVNVLLEAGAVAKSLGRVRWLEVDTREPWDQPRAIASFELHPSAFHSHEPRHHRPS
jgi:hypothetical protein